MIAPTLEGTHSRTHNPSHPAHPNQPIRCSLKPQPPFLYQPVFPVSKNTREPSERGHHSATCLVCLSCLTDCFLFSLSLFAYSTCIRVDCFSHCILRPRSLFLPVQRLLFGPHSAPSCCFLPTRHSSLRPTHSISIKIDRAGTGCVCCNRLARASHRPNA